MLRLKTTIKDLFNSLVELLYPSICCVCERILVRGENYICTKCNADFPFVYRGDGHEARLIAKTSQYFIPCAAFSLFYYDKYSEYKNILYAIKYKSNASLAVYMGEFLGRKLSSELVIDYILPIPLHRRKKKIRGFNQAQKIAEGLNRYLDAEIIEDIIIRHKNNDSQTGKSSEERLCNVGGIFSLNISSCYIVKMLENKSVLIVDDVITTGATLNSFLSCLPDLQSTKFYVACLGQTM